MIGQRNLDPNVLNTSNFDLVNGMSQTVIMMEMSINRAMVRSEI